MRRWPLVLPLLFAGSLPVPAAAQAVYRCTDAEGRAVFTDQPCESIQAVPRAAPGEAAPAGATLGGQAALGCARTPEALRQGVREALSLGDVNRLANYYHWPGTGSGSARHLMDALEAIAARPLVGLDWWPPRPARADASAPGTGSAAALEGASWPPPGPGPANSPPSGPGQSTALASERSDPPSARGARPGPTTDPLATPPSDATAPGDPAFAPPPLRPALPALRAEQAGGPGDAGAYRTDFRLRRHAGCWWIEL